MSPDVAADPTLDRARELAEMWRRIHEDEAEMVARWAPTLTREIVAEIERKMEADEDLTRDELEQHHVAVKLTQPTTADEPTWDRWYATPVSKMLPVMARPSSVRTDKPTPRPVRRARHRRRARSPGRRTGADDGDPDPEPDLAAKLAGVLAELGPLSASALALQVRRRKAAVLEVLHDDGRFAWTGKRRASRWAFTTPVRSFDASEAAEVWGVSVELAEEFLVGPEGFVELGFVTSLNGNGRFVISESGREISYAVGSLESLA